MKKVIFICLLSLSLCLSKPTDDQGKLPPTQHNSIATTLEPKIQNTTEKSPSETSITTEQKPAVTSTTIAKNNATTEASIAPSETKTNTSQPAPNENKTKKDAEPQKESEKKVEPTQPTESATEAKAGTTDKDKNNTPVKPEEKKENATVPSTEKSVVTTTIKPTEAPKKDEDKPTLKARGFDGPSFIGGIILTLGLLAIGFMGFKYYKNQTERNYHTL